MAGPPSQNKRANARLPPEVTRALYVKNLPFKITPEEIFDIFGKYGAIRQIRLGDKNDTRGTAFVVYEDIYDAKAAVDHLSGFNVCGRYLIVLYYQSSKKNPSAAGNNIAETNAAKKEEIENMRNQHGL